VRSGSLLLVNEHRASKRNGIEAKDRVKGVLSGFVSWNRSSNANDSGYVAFENQQSNKHVIPVHRVWRKPDLLGLYGQVNKRIR
jgi:hypothetical protein